jgi:hypothetical protein
MESIVGAWSVAVTTPNQGTFPALLAFTSDGTVTGAESPGPFESSGHGSWVSRDNGEVAYTFLSLFGSSESKNTGKLKVIGTLQQDGNSSGWHGPFKIEGYDAKGDVTFSDRGTFSMTRIEVEPLD